MNTLGLLHILVIAIVGFLATPDAPPATTDEPQPVHNEPTHPDPEVDRILTELETADLGMRDLRARIVYDRLDATLGDRQYRFGELFFRDQTPEGQQNRAGTRSFVVRFNRYADLDVVRDLNESWAFDGRWLIERNDDDRTFRKREITRAGQEVDPLRLGEGPLPIPIGQRKADILSRYAVEMVDPVQSLEADDDAASEDPFASYREAVERTGAIQLKLRPLQKEQDDFDTIRLWYWKSGDNPDRWLPLMARASRTNARGREVDTAIVLMTNVEVNSGVTNEQMIVPEPTDGYTVQIDRLPMEGER